MRQRKSAMKDPVVRYFTLNGVAGEITCWLSGSLQNREVWKSFNIAGQDSCKTGYVKKGSLFIRYRAGICRSYKRITLLYFCSLLPCTNTYISVWKRLIPSPADRLYGTLFWWCWPVSFRNPASAIPARKKNIHSCFRRDYHTTGIRPFRYRLHPKW